MWKVAQPSLSSFSPQESLASVSESRTGGRSSSSGAGARGGASTHFPDKVLVHGDLNAEEDVIIDGIMSGTIDMPAHALTISPGAQVDAKVFARDVTVFGTLSGKITATEILDIRDSARVSGELAAPSVVLAEGAHVNGRIETKRVDAAVHVARYRMARNAR